MSIPKSTWISLSQMCARRAAYTEISILGFTTHAMTSQVAVYTPAEVGTGCHPTGGYPFRRWGACRSRISPGDPKHDQYGPKATQTWIQDGPNSLQTHLIWNQDADQRRRNVREASGRCSGSRFGRRKACWEGDIGGLEQNRLLHKIEHAMATAPASQKATKMRRC